MRILQISSAASFAGGERHVVDLSNLLAARGHDVHVAVRPNSPLIPHLRLPPGNISTLPLRNALDPQSARGLGRIVASNAIDVVHAHMARDYSLAAYAARQNSQTSFVVTRHVLFPLSRFHRRTLVRASRIIAVSAATGKQLRSQGLLAPERIVVIRNGIDIDQLKRVRADDNRSHWRKSLGVPANCLLVGSMGELRKLKRHDDFVRASALVAEELPNVHFILAGAEERPHGKERERLEKLVAELGLTERFHFVGWLDSSSLLFGSVDVFVSASETESFGLAIAEAMGSGKAVVSTATEGASELIVDGESGLLVQIGDIKQIASAISLLLKDDRRRQLLAARGEERMAEQFSLRRMIDEVEELYGKL